MKVLGLGGSVHDYSACLVWDGVVQYAIEDERLSRIKHSNGLDDKTIAKCLAAEYCLTAAGLSVRDIDLIVGNNILNPLYFSRLMNEKNDNLRMINHHLAHAASAFYPSNFEEAAILVVDGAGSLINTFNLDNETASFYYGKGSEITEIRKDSGRMVGIYPEPKVQSSLGGFYTAVTEAIGFKKFDEGKTMGLAPYGTDRFVHDFYSFYHLNEEGKFICTVEHGKRRMLFHFRHLKKRPGLDEEELFQIKADMAYALQYHLERILVTFCRYLYDVTKSKNLCLAGGVALNSVANYKILEQTPFEHLFVQPAASDNGTSIGSALYGYHQIMNQSREAGKKPLFSPYLGKAYDEAAIEGELSIHRSRLRIMKPDDIYQTTAKLLSEGNIMGWFQGRSEIGPRALGNRSILADPRKGEMKDIINSRIKHREAFRPFAPIVMEEYQEQYFTMKHPSYYMLLVPYIHANKQSVIPAVTHADGTGRVQTVTRDLNPKLHRLISSFNEMTGVPVLLNTSFNDNGEPIVESPADAISCFLNIDLDYLVLHDYLIAKEEKQ